MPRDDLAVSTTTSPYWSSGLGRGDAHPLVPALHARDRVRLHTRKVQVLVHAGVVPPDRDRCRRSDGLIRRHDAIGSPPARLSVHESCRAGSIVGLAGGPRTGPSVFVEPPAAHVVRRSDDTGPNALGSPGLDHEVADASRDAHEIRSAIDTRASRRRHGWIHSGCR